jgi:hypothetical protein
MTFRTRLTRRPHPSAVIAAGALAVGSLALTGTGAAAAAPAAATHTLTIRSTGTGHKQLTGHHIVFTTRDTIKGKYGGSGILTGILHPKTNEITASSAIALSGGIIYASLTVNGPTGTFTGGVTGGSGIYKGITGILKGRPINAKTTVVTITYKK